MLKKYIPGIYILKETYEFTILSPPPQVSSPAATTLRPRFGKEYSRVDRRRLVEELSINSAESSPAALPGASPSTVSTVFTFDVGGGAGTASSSRAGSFVSDSCCSTDNDSPKSPALGRIHGNPPPEHVYMNICFPNARRAGSPLVVDTSSGAGGSRFSAEQSTALLNYAKIDLSGSGSEDGGRSKVVAGAGSKRGGGENVEYAMIDMVATAAASRVGKEHAKQREDSLRRNNSFRRAESHEGWRSRGHKDRKGSSAAQGGSHVNGRDRKSSSSASKNSGGSNTKDRKFSSPM